VEVEKAGEREHVVTERLLTIPNVLSVLRLLGVPVFLWAILSERDGLALLLLLFSGVTDYLDGKIARQFNMESRLGQFLDPIADRLYILTTLLGLAWRDIIPVWLVVVLLARELVMALMLLFLRSRGQLGLPVHFVGKAATFNLLYAFPLLLLGEGSSTFAQWAGPIGWAFAWWGTVLYWIAGVMYIVQARRVARAHAAAAS
jgi:cardiolipin synthase